MIEIIIFVLPTIISLIIHDALKNRENDVYSIIKAFGGYCLLDNLLVMAVLYLYKNGEFYLSENIQRFDFVFKYFVLASVIATVLPVLVEFIKRNVTIKFIFKEVKNEENN